MATDVELSVKTPGYSVKHRKLGRPGGPGLWGRQNWQLPAYIQNVAHGIMRKGHSRSRAIQLAIGTIKNWASGQGDVSPEVRAASAKAIAEWNSLKARAAATRGGRSKRRRRSTSLSYSQEGRRTTMPTDIVSYQTGPSQKARAQAQKKGQAFKSGRFPIRNVSDLRKAIHAFGRVRPEDKAALQRFIARRARALGRADLIPESWRSGGGNN